MSEQAPVFVVAACIVRGERVLLAQRSQPENPLAHLRWELPGGKVEIEESPHEALVREIQEELGTKIELVRLLPHLQSNIYRTDSGTLHSIVVAFECVSARGAPPARPSDPSIRQVRWVDRKHVERLPLLPGTHEFIVCLQNLERATYSATQTYVRLEKVDSMGRVTDYWELRALYDLWSQFNIFERHGNVMTKSSHHRVKRNLKEEDVLSELMRRVRQLARHGYRITSSDDPRMVLGAHY